MNEEEIKLVEEYIKSHKPQQTVFETINEAVIAVTKDRRALREDELVNPADAWLVPQDEAKRFGGVGPISGRKWTEGVLEKTKQRLEAAAQYAIDHADEISEEKDEVNDLSKMLKEYSDYNNIVSNIIDKGNKNI